MEASTLVIFGATGDLTARKLIPALFELTAKGLLPKEFNIVGFARRPLNDKTFKDEVKKNLLRFDKNFSEKIWLEFIKRIYYVQGDLVNEKDFEKLAAFLKRFDPPNSCTNKIFYMATSPNYFETIIENLESIKVTQLMGECWTRIIIEKPFGKDLPSARKLNQLINSKFDENLVYRIDHYLAKETVQNILAFRFTNSLFEKVWNKDFIDHIQITVAEDFGVENRAGYYDAYGNLRDIVQNHMLQLLALMTMEPPNSFSAEDIRDARLSALKNLKPLSETEVKENVVLGQYLGYLEEDKVLPNSKTDTFTAMKIYLNSDNWKNVPIYLRSGKNLPKRAAYINVVFKKIENRIFKKGEIVPNILTFQIQPNQEISISIAAKEPGNKLKIVPVELHFNYDETFNVKVEDAYEKLLLDIVAGVQTFFPRSDEVEASWEFLDKIIKLKGTIPLRVYKKNSFGPKEAEELISKDQRDWLDTN